MTTQIKAALLAVTALAMTAGVAGAAPGKHDYGWGKPGMSQKYNKRGVSGAERAAIARSAANLSALKARAWRDGRLTFVERIQINNAERRHAALVARAYRS